MEKQEGRTIDGLSPNEKILSQQQQYFVFKMFSQFRARTLGAAGRPRRMGIKHSNDYNTPSVPAKRSSGRVRLRSWRVFSGSPLQLLQLPPLLPNQRAIIQTAIVCSNSSRRRSRSRNSCGIDTAIKPRANTHCVIIIMMTVPSCLFLHSRVIATEDKPSQSRRCLPPKLGSHMFDDW